MSRRASGGFMQTAPKALAVQPEQERSLSLALARYEAKHRPRSADGKTPVDRSDPNVDQTITEDLKVSNRDRHSENKGKDPRSRSDSNQDEESKQGDGSASGNQDILRHASDKERTAVALSAPASRLSRQGFSYTRLSPRMQYELSQYWFMRSRQPSPQERNILWRHLKSLDHEITETQITRWFENRRAAEKRQKSEAKMKVPLEKR